LSSFSQLKEELEKMGYSKRTRKEITVWYEPHEETPRRKEKTE